MKERFERVIKLLDLIFKSFSLTVCIIFLIAYKSKENIQETFLFLSTIKVETLNEMFYSIFIGIFILFFVLKFLRNKMQGKNEIPLQTFAGARMKDEKIDY